MVKPASKFPLGKTRATRLAVIPLYFVKLPTITTLPLVCKTNPYTIPLLAAIDVLNVVSMDPSLFNRINRFALIPLKVVKEPPKIILPSGCIKEQYTLPLKLVPKLNERSLEPSGSNRHKYLVTVPLKFK